MSKPTHCPNPDCLNHRAPENRFYVKKGTYRVKCRRRPVTRYGCRSCGRGFSSQTFRADYRDHKPGRNLPLLELLASGVSHRRAARALGLSRSAVMLKVEKLAAQVGLDEVGRAAPLRERCRLILAALGAKLEPAAGGGAVVKSSSAA